MVVMKLNFKVHGLLWNEINSLSHYIVPPLPTLEGDHSFASVFSKLNGKNQSTFSGEYKGSMGRITVIGGSKDYTGTILVVFIRLNILKCFFWRCSLLCSNVCT